MRTRSKNIGKFRTKVTFQRQGLVADGAGGFTNTWVNDQTVWANVEPLTGKEAIQAEQLTGDQSYRFIIRWTNDFLYTLDSSYRIAYGSRYFNIHSVKVLDFEDQFIEIMGWEV